MFETQVLADGGDSEVATKIKDALLEAQHRQAASGAGREQPRGRQQVLVICGGEGKVNK
jgi:hypothetical protein